jgi:yecA family protein
MQPTVEHEDLDAALRRCGAGWDAAQAHGLLCGRLAVAGRAAGADWLAEVTGDFTVSDSNRADCEQMLQALLERSVEQLSERQSGFQPLLPDDAAPAEQRAEALAHWCEGFLHGLVSGPHSERLKARLASEPLSGIIKDTLEITRATAGEDAEETVEEAYAELVEYVRTATQLVYEELAPWRGAEPPDDAVH